MACIFWYRWKEGDILMSWEGEKDENEYSIYNKWQSYTGPLG